MLAGRSCALNLKPPVSCLGLQEAALLLMLAQRNFRAAAGMMTTALRLAGAA